MKVLVPVKRVVDYNVRVRARSDGSGVDLANLKMSMNPFDEIAMEAAVRLKEAGQVSDVVAVSIGTDACQDVLRTALAFGADRAILVKTPEAALEPVVVSRILKAIVDEEAPQLVLMGKQAIDDDCNQTAQMLAARLGWGQGTFACRLVLADGEARVSREVDGGTRTVALPLPAVVSTDLRLNEPRYLKLPNIMKAKKKPLDIKPLDSLGVNTSTDIRCLGVSEPPARKPGVRVESVEELLHRLKHDAQVI
ncbi:electron transfer flavoprotein subunit beta/FixA family protein [Ectothiorhodospira lacustris]|uniref:electron transfer flavoprotein subunit beta/FixA family protein n=1 Tax=Ectothiorhodospira lacustris TaxID=2899127 RepID=UPI001EE85C64|nr:electron transfer flavoprotein subunit beta/FixA family protein [Ectothiorhodospira lacustris]MCG5501125.1 electron transfer flavoprotein subunit beta/FixA family protein [Ectothiorhodospira lacustris]MCG5511233.1 electron transfer flavoprotein subunit beta/FixA family protein [Ectothiorhodospira lacustris]MCG5522951.1 electron transfer flavoprotein subunit beta/FixA family protein [Ectothiorhodospira lacustris]